MARRGPLIMQPGFHSPIADPQWTFKPCKKFLTRVSRQTGKNSVGHWTRWCCLPVKALQMLIGDEPIKSTCKGAGRGPHDVTRGRCHEAHGAFSLSSGGHLGQKGRPAHTG